MLLAVRDGGKDRFGLPMSVPHVGGRYIVTGTYEMPYGLGCTLLGMDPSPYRGYILHKRSKKDPRGVWFFVEVDPAEDYLKAQEIFEREQTKDKLE